MKKLITILFSIISITCYGQGLTPQIMNLFAYGVPLTTTQLTVGGFTNLNDWAKIPTNSTAPMIQAIHGTTGSKAIDAETNVTLLVNGTGLTITLPAPSVHPGQIANVKNATAGWYRLVSASGTIDGQTAITNRVRFGTIILQSDGTNWNTLSGNYVPEQQSFGNAVQPSAYGGNLVLVNATAAVTNLAPIGYWTDGQTYSEVIQDDGTARAITWNTTVFTNRNLLPFTTKAGVRMYIEMRYNAATTMFECQRVSYSDGAIVVGRGGTNNISADGGVFVANIGNANTWVVTNGVVGVGVTPLLASYYSPGSLLVGNTISAPMHSINGVYALVKNTNVTTAPGCPLWITTTSITNITYTLHGPVGGTVISFMNCNDSGFTTTVPSNHKIVSHGNYYQSASCGQKGMYTELRGANATNWVWYAPTNGWTFTQ